MSQKEDIVNLLNLNKIMTQGVLAEAIYGDKSHSPNIYAALKALLDKGVVFVLEAIHHIIHYPVKRLSFLKKLPKSNKKEMRDVSGDVISDETLEEIEALVQGTDNYGPENELITRCLKKFTVKYRSGCCGDEGWVNRHYQFNALIPAQE